jgi:hypothetical protein
MRYAARVSAHGAGGLRALLQGSGAEAWRRELRAAVAALRSMLAPLLDGMPEPVGDAALGQWERLWSRHAGPWHLYMQRFAKAVLAAPRQYERLAARVRGRHPGAGGAGFDADENGEWLCVDCGREFAARASLQMHQQVVHGRRCAARHVVATPECPACGRWWHSRVRALRHVTHARACRALLEAGALPRLSAEVVDAADAGDRAWRRTCRASGVCSRSGPPPLAAPPLPLPL